MNQQDPADLTEALRRAFEAAMPHLLEAARELKAAGVAFVEALTEETAPVDPEPEPDPEPVHVPVD